MKKSHTGWIRNGGKSNANGNSYSPWYIKRGRVIQHRRLRPITR